MVTVRLVSRNLVHGHFKRWLAAIVGIGLHAQPDCVATTGFHNKVSIVPESPWPKVFVSKKFEIQIQICNRFFCNRFVTDFVGKNVVRKHSKIWIIHKIETPRCRLHIYKQHTKNRISHAVFIIERHPSNPRSRYAGFRYILLGSLVLSQSCFLFYRYI